MERFRPSLIEATEIHTQDVRTDLALLLSVHP